MTENIQCKELFELFTKMGGKLSCNYNKQKCKYTTRTIPKNTKTCDITEDCLDIKIIDKKLQNYVMENDNNNNNNKIEKFYNYKGGAISEFIIYSTVNELK